MGHNFIIHRGAYVSSDIIIGNGTRIMAGAEIRSGAVIGENCTIEKNVVIEGECEIGNNVTFTPGNVLIVVHPGAKIGDGCQIKPGADIGEGSEIGRNCVIGAGVILKNTQLGDDVVLYDCALSDEESSQWISRTLLDHVKVQEKSTIHAGVQISPGTLVGKNNMFKDNVHIYESVNIGHENWFETGITIHSTSVIGNGNQFKLNVTIPAKSVIGNANVFDDNANLPEGFIIEDGVHIETGLNILPNAQLRAINYDGTTKTQNTSDEPVTIKSGVYIGKNSKIARGVTVGKWAMVEPGTIVHEDVPEFGYCCGEDGAIVAFMCPCENELEYDKQLGEESIVQMFCPKCEKRFTIPLEDWKRLSK